MEAFGLRNVKTGEMIKFSSRAFSSGGYAIQRCRLSEEGDNVWISTNKETADNVASLKDNSATEFSFTSSFENPSVSDDLFGKLEVVKISF